MRKPGLGAQVKCKPAEEVTILGLNFCKTAHHRVSIMYMGLGLELLNKTLPLRQRFRHKQILVGLEQVLVVVLD